MPVKYGNILLTLLKLAALVVYKFTFNSFAIALAIVVLPRPGGPSIKT